MRCFSLFLSECVSLDAQLCELNFCNWSDGGIQCTCYYDRRRREGGNYSNYLALYTSQSRIVNWPICRSLALSKKTVGICIRTVPSTHPKQIWVAFFSSDLLLYFAFLLSASDKILHLPLPLLISYQILMLPSQWSLRVCMRSIGVLRWGRWPKCSVDPNGKSYSISSWLWVLLFICRKKWISNHLTFTSHTTEQIGLPLRWSRDLRSGCPKLPHNHDAAVLWKRRQWLSWLDRQHVLPLLDCLHDLHCAFLLFQLPEDEIPPVLYSDLQKRRHRNVSGNCVCLRAFASVMFVFDLIWIHV